MWPVGYSQNLTKKLDMSSSSSFVYENMSIGITRATKHTMRGTTLGRTLKDPRYAATQLCRLYSFTSTSDPHIQTLLLNTELSLDDASNELRWIIAEVRDEANKMMTRGKLPPIEEERVEELVKRRSAGEPLQYILGKTLFRSCPWGA